MEAAELTTLVQVEDRHWWYKERRALLARELRRLPAPEIVQGNVAGALQPAFRVPRGLAMADIIDRGRRHRSCGQSFASEISGASGRFMPTT